MYETGGTRRRSAINGSWLILLDILNSFVGKREYEDEFNEVERCVKKLRPVTDPILACFRDFLLDFLARK